MNDLMKPRFKVIADYPFNPFEVGEILYEHEGKFWVYEDSGRYPINPEAFPAIYKKIEWWEDRKAEEMPEYLKSLINQQFYKVLQSNEISFSAVQECPGGLGIDYPWSNVIPATLEEYNDYINQVTN